MLIPSRSNHIFPERNASFRLPRKRPPTALGASDFLLLPHEQGLADTAQKRRRATVDLKAPGFPKLALLEAAAEYADRGHMSFAGCLGMIRRVTDGNGMFAGDPQLLERWIRIRRAQASIARRLPMTLPHPQDWRSPRSPDHCSISLRFAEDAMAIRIPASRARRSKSGTAENGRISDMYLLLKRLLRHASNSAPCCCCSRGERKAGISLSPPFLIWLRTCSNVSVMTELGQRFVPRDRVQVHRIQKRTVEIEYRGLRQACICRRASPCEHSRTARPLARTGLNGAEA